MADPVKGATDAAKKAGNAAVGVLGKIAKLPLSWKFWAVAGVGVIACAGAAPAAMALTATNLPAATSLTTAFSNVASLTGTALTNGAPVLGGEALEIGKGIFGAVKTGVGAAISGGPV